MDLIKAVTELVSSLPYGTYSIDNRQAIYNDWLKKYEQDLKIMQSRYDNFIEHDREPGDFDKPSSINDR